MAQSEGALSAEFSRMSPKERARVARQEQADAALDTAYQGIMARAEGLFQAGRYDDAIVVYEEARSRRPLNVYPKVKIEDLQVLIRKREEEMKRTAPGPITITSSAGQEPAVDAAVDTAVAQPAIGPAIAPPDERHPPAPTTSPSRPVRAAALPSEKRTQPPTVRTAEPRSEPVRDSHPDGILENRYAQGNAEVTEIYLTGSGRTTVFKRVVHKWGQVYYFEDGQAIDGRVWRQHFGDRP